MALNLKEDNMFKIIIVDSIDIDSFTGKNKMAKNWFVVDITAEHHSATQIQLAAMSSSHKQETLS